MDNQQQQQPPQKSTNKLIYFIPAIIIVFALVFVLVNKQRNTTPGSTLPENNQLQNPSAGQGVQPTTSVINEKGTFTLSSKEQKTSYSVGETITIVVTADSNNKPITGYDVVLPYEESVLTYKGNSSLDARYQVFGNVKNGNVYITGVKKLSINEPVVFIATPLVEIHFLTEKAGSVTFAPSIVPQSKSDSNLIDDQNKEVLGKAVPLTIEIR